MKKYFQIILGGVVLLTALLLTVAFFDRIPIEGTTLAMDWKGLWTGIRGGAILYGNATGLRIPPWSVLVVLPLGLLPFRASWGVLTFLTMIVLMLSVPPTKSRPAFLVGVLVLTLSFPTLRTIVDGNFEVLVIGGCLLVGYGMSKPNAPALVAGVLLASSKVQESWLLLLLLPVLVIKFVRREIITATIAGLVLICVPSLIWKGPEWIRAVFAIAERNSIMDSSLWAATGRLEIPFPFTALLATGIVLATGAVIWTSRELRWREQIGLMVAASLLLAPYTTGNNFLTLYAIAGMALLQSSVPVGLVVIGLANLPFAFIGYRDVMYTWSATYWTMANLIVWAILIVRLSKRRTPLATQPANTTPSTITREPMPEVASPTSGPHAPDPEPRQGEGEPEPRRKAFYKNINFHRLYLKGLTANIVSSD